MTKNEFARFGILPSNRSDGKLELQLRCLVRAFRLMRAELRSNVGLPWKQRLRAWKAGFISNSWVMYDLAANNPDLYVSDLRWVLNMYRINGFYNPIIGNKLVSSRLLEHHKLPHPEVISLVFKGKLFEDGSTFHPDMRQTLLNTLDRYPHQVFRPISAGGGEGVFFLERGDSGLKLNGREVTPEFVCSLLAGLDRYVATEFVEQAEYARAIYPEATNTVRVLSLWDDKDGTPFIAGAVHRFGSSRSKRVDNFHGGRGGLSALVDLESSTMARAATQSADKKLLWVSSHPDSGQPIEGVGIPGLAKCIEGVRAAAAHFPFCPCIGWDVVLTKDGYRILETNTLPSLTVMQVNLPLLKDPRNRRVFRHWGMVPGKPGIE